MLMRVSLKKHIFTEKETLFVDLGNLKAYLLRYESGICSVKIENELGYITVLPFNGQMIWDAVFYGRSLKMQNSFTIPRKRDIFRDTYGCYLMHCGILTMGCPSPEDTHPHHGELPYVEYDSAYIISGEDEKGKYIGVTGEYEHNRAFGDHYIARPYAKLYENSSLIDFAMEVENLSTNPMEYMYMAHLNNAVVDGAELIQTLPWTPEHMVARLAIPQYNETSDEFIKLLDRIQEDVGVTRVVDKGDFYDPEIVLFLRNLITDDDGKAHFLYLHKDGTADYTTYDANILNCAVRWIVRHQEWKAMGMVLPSTAEPEGYIAEKLKGNIKVLPANETFSAQITAGYVQKDEAKKIKDKINNIMAEYN